MFKRQCFSVLLSPDHKPRSLGFEDVSLGSTPHTDFLSFFFFFLNTDKSHLWPLKKESSKHHYTLASSTALIRAHVSFMSRINSHNLPKTQPVLSNHYWLLQMLWFYDVVLYLLFDERYSPQPSFQQWLKGSFLAVWPDRRQVPRLAQLVCSPVPEGSTSERGTWAPSGGDERSCCHVLLLLPLLCLFTGACHSTVCVCVCFAKGNRSRFMSNDCGVCLRRCQPAEGTWPLLCTATRISLSEKQFTYMDSV